MVWQGLRWNKNRSPKMRSKGQQVDRCKVVVERCVAKGQGIGKVSRYRPPCCMRCKTCARHAGMILMGGTIREAGLPFFDVVRRKPHPTLAGHYENLHHTEGEQKMGIFAL